MLAAIWIVIQIQEFFKGFFIYYCDSYRQLRIKHENTRWRFALTECSLLNKLLVFVIGFIVGK